MDWLNDNAGAVQAVAAAVTVILTGALVFATLISRRKTDEAIRASQEANEIARGAIEAARATNLVTARGFFGANLAVSAREPGRFIITNLGRGPARGVMADWEVEGKPVGDPPQHYPNEVPGHGQGPFYFGGGPGPTERDYEWTVQPPAGYHWSPGNAWGPGAVESRLRVRYSDSFPGEQEVRSKKVPLVPETGQSGAPVESQL